MTNKEDTNKTVPLALEHRQLLVREARIYGLMSFFPAFPLFLLLIFACSPDSVGHRVLIWPLIVLCGTAFAVCLASCRACLRDARTNYAEVCIRRLDRRRDSPRYPTTFHFSGGPEHLRVAPSWQPQPTPEGAWYRISYSPRSAMLWTIEPVPAPPAQL